jgi:hypothetical protein
MADKKEPDMTLPPASSVVMKAIDATTFTEMEGFVKDLEGRPIERLLKDLPDLAGLPATKVSLVSYVITAKYREGDAPMRNMIKESIQATLNRMGIDERRDRVAQMFERLR